MCVEPALEDKRSGKLVDFVAAGVGIGRIMACGLQGGVGFGGREALVPEVDVEAGPIRNCGTFGCRGRGFGNEGFQLIHKAVDAIGLATAISGQVQRIPDDNADAAVAAREAENGTLVVAGPGALNGEQRLRDAERVRERDTDAARAHIQAEPRLGDAHVAIIGKLRQANYSSHASRRAETSARRSRLALVAIVRNTIGEVLFTIPAKGSDACVAFCCSCY